MKGKLLWLNMVAIWLNFTNWAACVLDGHWIFSIPSAVLTIALLKILMKEGWEGRWQIRTTAADQKLPKQIRFIW